LLKENKNGFAMALRFMGVPPRISDFSIWVIWKMAEIANPKLALKENKNGFDMALRFMGVPPRISEPLSDEAFD
jgi:hypothetical protein